jgi:hypothetical protein
VVGSSVESLGVSNMISMVKIACFKHTMIQRKVVFDGVATGGEVQQIRTSITNELTSDQIYVTKQNIIQVVNS